MKQAFLITAYKNFEELHQLVCYLAKGAYVYVHIDQNGEITNEQTDLLKQVEGCTAICQYGIAWGGFSHVNAILALMELVSRNQDVAYVHLLTGEDLPLIDLSELDQRFLPENRIFMDVIPFCAFTEQVKKRYLYHNWFADQNVKNPLLWQLQNLTVNLQKLFGVRRTHLGEFANEQVYKGLVYISMPMKALCYVTAYCNKHPEFLKDLRDCQIPEEFFFQTILTNSDFAKDIDGTSIRYMDWESGDGGSPAYLNMENLKALKQGNYAFARKFHPVASKELREKLFEGKAFP